MTSAGDLLPPPRTSERLLIEAAREIRAERVACNTLGRAQFGYEYLRQHPQAIVHCLILDSYPWAETRRLLGPGQPPQLRLVCAADFPREEVDLSALAIRQDGDAELTRELLQQGHERLVIGGQLVAATDNPRDQWLHDQLRDLFVKVTRRPVADGVVYLATKTGPLKKRRDFSCQFTFRDGDRLLHLRTRPGVFSHRSLDGGARALIETMEVLPGMRILDLGCGSGAVGLAAACREPGAVVHAVDSHSRAIEAVAWAAGRNEASNMTWSLDAGGSSAAASSFDLVLANPPYYSHFRLAELFAQIAHRSLRPGGVALFVTKRPDWYAEEFPSSFASVDITPFKSYFVVRATR